MWLPSLATTTEYMPHVGNIIHESKTSSRHVKNENDASTIANLRLTSVAPGAMRYDSTLFCKQNIALQLPRSKYGDMVTFGRYDDLDVYV